MYTIDGSDPKIYGFEYIKPIKINDNTTLRLVPVENGEFKEEVAYYYKVPTNTTYKETVFIEHPLSQDFDKLTLINFVSSTEITLKIYNADSDIKDANVYIATYGNGGKMKDIIPNTSDLALGETTVTIPVDNVSTPVEKIKVLIWNDNLVPYATAFEIN